MATIGLEATRANKRRKTGTEWYAWHLLQQFKKIDQKNKFIVYYNHELASDLPKAPANFYFKKLNWPLKKLWTHLRLGPELWFHPPDKFFVSNAVPIISKGELTVTIHDLGFLKNPKLYHPGERIYHRWAHKLAITKAKKIIAVSHSTADDILRYFPQTKAKLRVIYNGWDQENFRPASTKTKNEIKEKFDLPDKFLLYIGRLETKKNIQNLLKAFKLVKNQDYHLILAGRSGNYGYQEIVNLSRDPKIRNRVRLLGYVNQADYQELLASADIFVFPSKFEGFGIPILEAMGSGVPVICSDIPVLREVGAQAAMYFHPHNPQMIANQLDRLMDSVALQEELSRRGLKHAQNFSWEKCARETLDFILE